MWTGKGPTSRLPDLMRFNNELTHSSSQLDMREESRDVNGDRNGTMKMKAMYARRCKIQRRRCEKCGCGISPKASPGDEP